MRAQIRAIVSTVAFVFTGVAHSHEGAGRAGLKNVPAAEVESEVYIGKRGYLHGGLGIIAPLGERQRIGVISHFVREDSGGELFPSLGAEFIQEFSHGTELEVFSFGYFPVERQHAWALGARGRHHFDFDGRVTLSPFFGPAYARVQAIDEDTSQPVSIGHFMLLAGLGVQASEWEITLFGTHSAFTGNPFGLETHVDLEEMTHFASYENNDGFARNTAGMEISRAFGKRLTLLARYAWIDYGDEIRHSISLAPELKVGNDLRILAGVQLLRGGKENDLFFGGISWSF
jgi:hypothetical protein